MWINTLETAGVVYLTTSSVEQFQMLKTADENNCRVTPYNTNSVCHYALHNFVSAMLYHLSVRYVTNMDVYKTFYLLLCCYVASTSHFVSFYGFSNLNMH